MKGDNLALFAIAVLDTAIVVCFRSFCYIVFAVGRFIVRFGTFGKMLPVYLALSKATYQMALRVRSSAQVLISYVFYNQHKHEQINDANTNMRRLVLKDR